MELSVGIGVGLEESVEEQTLIQPRLDQKMRPGLTLVRKQLLEL